MNKIDNRVWAHEELSKILKPAIEKKQPDLFEEQPDVWFLVKQFGEEDDSS